MFISGQLHENWKMVSSGTTDSRNDTRKRIVEPGSLSVRAAKLCQYDPPPAHGERTSGGMLSHNATLFVVNPTQSSAAVPRSRDTDCTTDGGYFIDR
jgi:hypothetical protein